ncbi:MAG: type II/IV secretion system protein, partial [Acidobacteria bacterium]|nr:type II/IV secretion system protein [Acidobacteriota bacterium]
MKPTPTPTKDRDTNPGIVESPLLPKVLDAASEESRAKALAQRLGMPYIDLWTFRVDAELFKNTPLEWMLRYEFLPEREDNGTLHIIMTDPTDVVKRDELEGLLKRKLRVKVGSRAALQEILQKSESSQRVLDQATEEFKFQLVKEDEEGQEVLSIDRIAADASPIIKLVDSIVFNAIARRASDIHIETQDQVVMVKYRVDGVLTPAMEPIDKKHHQTIISRIKVMSELDIAEKRIPQDGRFKIRVKGRTIDFRVSIMPTVHGEDSVIRILDKESANSEFRNLRLDVLGMDPETLRRLRKAIREPYGMVLVTGPTGSGKTTSLYACLSEIQSVEDKIITIEDPVEYQLRGITQIPVNEKKGLTFARGLRSILRHDPDRVMVGEIRDAETAQIASQAALTGHLVLSTIHANNVFEVVGRFMHMGVDLYNMVSALNGVVAQRLMRKLCTHCAQPCHPLASELHAAQLPRDAKGRFMRAVGCSHCR